MREYYPLLLTGAVIGVFTLVFIIAFALIKDKKKAISFDRNMKDGEIIKRLLKYAKPHKWSFVLVFIIVVFSITYDVVSPLLIGRIEALKDGRAIFRSADSNYSLHLCPGHDPSGYRPEDTFRHP